MTRTEVRNYIAQIEKAIKDAGIEGISLTRTSASYSDDEFNVKIQFNTVSKDGKVSQDREETFLRDVFKRAGKAFEGSIIGSHCIAGGHGYTIIGAKTNARKNCVIIKSKDGNKYVCPVEGLYIVK